MLKFVPESNVWLIHQLNIIQKLRQYRKKTNMLLTFPF